MALRLYFDHNVRGAITIGLRLRGVDVLTAFEDQSHELPDDQLLDRASRLGRVLFTNDDDLLSEAAMRHRTSQSFAGVVYVHQERLTVGACINDLEILAKVAEPGEMANQVVFLPLV